MKVIEYWAIEVWDGVDRHIHRYSVSDEKTAKEWKVKNPHDYVVKRTLVIYESSEEMTEDFRKKLKEQALAKLTKEERIALGFH